jgi:chromosome segregation ATPase
MAEDARARKLVQAWSEAGQLREQLGDREQELADALQELRALRDDRRPLRERAEAAERDLATARKELEDARGELDGLDDEIEGAREELAGAVRDAAAERSSHEIECVELRGGLDELRAELEKMEAAGGRRRLGLRKRSRGAEPVQQQQEEQATPAALQLLREQASKLEADLREQESCNDDLRALLESEREQAARARSDADDLRLQLARDSRSGSAKDQPKPLAESRKPAPAKDAPPWSALDDELLARIEKAKALTS